jgi:hypothetical protein
MNASLDCIPCIMRQSLDAARLVTPDTRIHERALRKVSTIVSRMALDAPPPLLGQRIHRWLREITGNEDPYRDAKEGQNRLASVLMAELRPEMEGVPDPLEMALRLAIAGNTIDMGVHGKLTETQIRRSLREALLEPLHGDVAVFKEEVANARNILFLADNAGEIVFDRVLIEQLPPGRVTVAVRGGPIINDATIVDAHATGIHDVAEIIDNGSDAPGTILKDCSRMFRKRFEEADVVIAKGQGNFETLSSEPTNLFFLFKVKCEVVSAHVRLPVGANVLTRFSDGTSGVKRSW